MWFSSTSTRIGYFAPLVGVIVLSVFGSVIAADRALIAADQRSVELDARNAAVIIERHLRVRAEPLALFSLGRPGAPRTASGKLGDFDAVWVMDQQGRILWSLGDATQPEAGNLALLATATQGASWPRVHALRAATAAEAGALLLVTPLPGSGKRLGYAAGKMPPERILQVVINSTARQSWIAIDTEWGRLAEVGSRGDGALEARWSIGVPGDKLDVRVAYTQSGRVLRWSLWVLGALALAALWAGLVRERRQAVHLAGRAEELERLYQEVAKANRMKSEFLANVSHELRTPLNAIVGFAEMLKDGTYGDLTPRQALPVDHIATSTALLRELVDRLLDIGKIAAGRVQVHSEEMSLSPFVLDVVAEMEPLLKERGLSLSISAGSSLPRIKTDPTHLRQILINLMGNAAKYTAAGGIQIRARVVDGSNEHRAEGEKPQVPDTLADAARGLGAGRSWVALQVSDTGVGIADEDRERVFDEFEQVNAGARTDSAHRGTGLGLAISRRLARLLGGDLTVVSEPGRGSTFTVWLPFETRDEKRA